MEAVDELRARAWGQGLASLQGGGSNFVGRKRGWRWDLGGERRCLNELRCIPTKSRELYLRSLGLSWRAGVQWAVQIADEAGARLPVGRGRSRGENQTRQKRWKKGSGPLVPTRAGVGSRLAETKWRDKLRRLTPHLTPNHGLSWAILTGGVDLFVANKIATVPPCQTL